MITAGVVILAGSFSLLAAPLLIAAYAASGHFPRKTPFSLCAGLALSFVLMFAQAAHIGYALDAWQPVDLVGYRLVVFAAPGLFFLFGRAIALPDQPPTLRLVIHLLPMALPLFLPIGIALPLLLLLGFCYALWFTRLVYQLRGEQKYRVFELAFVACIAASAAVVLGFGIWGALGDWSIFYAVYAGSIAIAYCLVIFALAAYPDFVQAMFQATRDRYSTTTLTGVDVSAAREALQRLMGEGIYADETLTLGALA